MRIIFLEFQITVRNDPDQLFTHRDRHTGNAKFGHQIIRILQRMLRRQGKRVADDAVFRTLHLIDLIRLLLNRHILVNNADASLTCHGNCHPMLGDRVHSCAHHGNVQMNLLGELGADVNFIRQYVRIGRNQQNIIKCNSFANDLPHFFSFPDKMSFFLWYAS